MSLSRFKLRTPRLEVGNVPAIASCSVHVSYVPYFVLYTFLYSINMTWGVTFPDVVCSVPPHMICVDFLSCAHLNQFLRRADSVTSSDRLMVIRGGVQCVLLTVEDGSLPFLSFPHSFIFGTCGSFRV